jgi:excisionase family DNA binding protein
MRSRKEKKIRSSDNPRVMTLAEVADYIRVHRSTVYRLAKDDRMPATKVGNQWRFRRDLIDKWLAESKRISVRAGRHC